MLTRDLIRRGMAKGTAQTTAAPPRQSIKQKINSVFFFLTGPVIAKEKRWRSASLSLLQSNFRLAKRAQVRCACFISAETTPAMQIDAYRRLPGIGLIKLVRHKVRPYRLARWARRRLCQVPVLRASISVSVVAAGTLTSAPIDSGLPLSSKPQTY